MIIDLRDYTTAPGARDRLIARCEERFFPEQERLGARLLGVFRDAERDNRFVWLRAMPDLATRKRVLTEFYVDGTLWQAERNEVNSWIADSDNVLLTRPASAWGANALPGTDTIVAMYSSLASESPANAVHLLSSIALAVVERGGRLLVMLATDPVANNFPRHAIREGVTGFIWFASFPRGVDCRLPVPGIDHRCLLPTERSWLR